jgi:hypothetical protein
MSESDKTYNEISRHHKALYEEIVKNAWAIAGDMVVGGSRLVDGIYIPIEYLTLKEINEKVNKQLQS